MRPLGWPAGRQSPLVEIILGLLLLGALTLLVLPAYAYLALAFVALAFGAIGLAHRRALHALRDRVNELELELADQGVRLLVAIEEKQELEQRLAQDRSSGPRP